MSESEASSVEGAVDTVEGVPIVGLPPSDSCVGPAEGPMRGVEAGLRWSPSP